jgi:hypothetical protein
VVATAAVQAVDTIGAGDCFAGAFAYYYAAAGLPMDEACARACQAPPPHPPPPPPAPFYLDLGLLCPGRYRSTISSRVCPVQRADMGPAPVLPSQPCALVSKRLHAQVASISVCTKGTQSVRPRFDRPFEACHAFVPRAREL